MSHDPHRQAPIHQSFGPPQPLPYQPAAPGWVTPPPPPKTRRWPVFLGAGAAGLLGLCLFGSALANFADDSPSATVKPGKAAAITTDPVVDSTGDSMFDLAPNTVMTITDNDGSSQDAVIFRFRVKKSACSQFGGEPDHGIFLITDVLVTQTKGTGSVNPLNFTYVGSDGTTASAISGAFSGCAANDMGSTNALRQGAKRSGQIVFDVSSLEGSVEYAPGGFGAEAVGSWKVG